MEPEGYSSGALVPGKGDGDLIALGTVAAGAAALGALAVGVGAVAIGHAARRKARSRTIVIGDPDADTHIVRMRIVIAEEVVRLVNGK